MESTEVARDVVNVCAILCRDDALLAGGRRLRHCTSHPTKNTSLAALHLPVQSYVPADFQAGDRTDTAPSPSSTRVDTSKPGCAVQLSQLSSGLHSYVGFQRDDLGPRVTTTSAPGCTPTVSAGSRGTTDDRHRRCTPHDLEGVGEMCRPASAHDADRTSGPCVRCSLLQCLAWSSGGERPLTSRERQQVLDDPARLVLDGLFSSANVCGAQ